VAHKAVTAQFQARTCVNLGFCNSSQHIIDWVENHGFGDQYPNHHLPIKGCVHKGATREQSKLLCRACEAVVDVAIDRGQCLPQFKTLQPGSLQERVRHRSIPHFCAPSLNTIQSEQLMGFILVRRCLPFVL